MMPLLYVKTQQSSILDKLLVPRHRDYDMIQITPMRPNLTYQNHFDGALAYDGYNTEHNLSLNFAL
jgi:hypothetical protein